MSDLKTPAPAVESGNFISKARLFFAVTGGIYVLLIALLAIPYLQTHVLYLNALKFPFFADFNAPEKYGLSPNKTFNFKIGTIDNETIGAWFSLADPFYHSEFPPSLPEARIGEALKRHPTILFLHGNAATRAFHVRVQHYKAFTSRLASNVLAIDYRGFGDSSGHPTEAGVVCDARAAWDWLVSQGAKEQDILIIGHSLGTGIGSRLAANLSVENIPYRALVLLSPFSSITELLNTYQLFGFLPLMRPLSMIPHAAQLVIGWALTHKFDTLSVISDIKGPVLIAHAKDDWDIPHGHSDVLFNKFIDHLLPEVNFPPPGTVPDAQEWAFINQQLASRLEERSRLVVTTNMGKFGAMQAIKESGRDVVLVKTKYGGHDYLGIQEGLQDIIGRSFGLIT
ncbi:Alpha/Beta hydrolase protein [Mycena floridula]|nr:Alpha/Beta hydrolase protein [Mycena floridula]